MSFVCIQSYLFIMADSDLFVFLQISLSLAMAYGIGSIPATLLIGKFGYGIDIRDHGDGTATHSNVFNILGNNAGFAAIFANAAKGFLGSNAALLVIHYFPALSAGMDMLPVLKMAFGVAVVGGHIMPILLRQQGGTGVFCGIGALLAVQPWLSLVFMLITGIVLFIFRYQYLGYGVAALALPAVVIVHQHHLTENALFGATLVFCILLALMFGYTLRDKFGAILRGEAQQIHLRLRRRKR